MPDDTAILLIHSPDRPGLVHDVTGFIFSHGGNIVDLQQHIDPAENAFFMRIAWTLGGFTLDVEEIAPRFSILGKRHGMRWKLHFAGNRRRLALFVSKESHCLYDLLSRHEAGELPVDIPLILSNHDLLRPAAERFGIPFHHFPIHKDGKTDVERRQLELLSSHQIDTVVLARYMQIISPAFIEAYPDNIINIHHSFLPAFIGAKPYHQAFERGVKIIGATSHYVTADLDQGPIIHQDVTPVTHEDSVADLVRIGKDLEKNVLAKALWCHVTNKVLVYRNKTIVFA